MGKFEGIFDDIKETEIRIIGKETEPKICEKPEQQSEHKRKRKWWLVIGIVVFVLVVLLWGVLSKQKAPEHQPEAQTQEMAYSTAISETHQQLEPPAYVEISDTILNNVSLHRYIPVNAKPKLVMGVIKDIPDEYVLGAMAADFGQYEDKFEVVGGFVYQGEMMSHSKSKYGFCALLKDTLVIGDALSTSYFEQAIEEKGDFFRQHALLYDGKVVNRVYARTKALRRALCRLKDGRICVIDTNMSISLAKFSEALRQYDVQDAIALMGSGAAVRWAVDEAGRRYIAGADEYDFPDVVNYIVWEGKAVKRIE